MIETENKMFLIRPDLFEKESLIGYLYRIVKKIGYSNLSVISKLIDCSLPQIQSNFFDQKDVQNLARLTDKPLEELYSRTLTSLIEHIQIGPSDRQILMKNKIKYCPFCINQNHYHKSQWSLHPICICLDHQCLLIDYCPGCKGRITMKDFMNEHCNACGFKYSNSVAEPYQENSIHYLAQQTMQKSLLEKKSFYHVTGLLSGSLFFDLADFSFHLLEGLHSFIGDHTVKINAFYNKANGGLNNYKNLIAYGNYYWMYQDFPNHFHQVLKEFITKKNIKKVYIQKTQFERCFESGNHPMIQEAYNQFWLQQLDQGTIRKDFSVFKNDESLLQKRNTIRKDEVKEQTGMGYVKMSKLNDAGKLGLTATLKGKQTQYFVDKVSLEQLQLDQASLINKKEVASILGVQRESISGLVKAGVLIDYCTPIARYKLFKRDEVNLLLEDYRGIYQKSSPNGIRFHDALIKYSVNGLTIVLLLKFSREGLIKPKTSKIDGSLADAIYSESDLLKCVSVMKNEKQILEGYYLTDLLKIFHIGEKRLWSLIHNQTLIPDKVITFRDGRKRYLFSKEQVELFKLQ